MSKPPPPPPPPKPKALSAAASAAPTAPVLQSMSPLSSSLASSTSASVASLSSPGDGPEDSFSASDAARVSKASGGIRARMQMLGLDQGSAAAAPLVPPSAAIRRTAKDTAEPPSQQQPRPTSPVAAPDVKPSRKVAPPPPPSRSSSNPSSDPGVQATSHSYGHSEPDISDIPPRPPAAATLANAASWSSAATVSSPPSSPVIARLRSPLSRRRSQNKQTAQQLPVPQQNADGGDDFDDGRSLRSERSLQSNVLPKRDRIIQEIVDTERTYLQDLKLLREIYVAPCAANNILNPGDMKILFGNIDAIISTSTQVYTSLMNAANSATTDALPAATRIANAFLVLAPQIQETYSEYVKNNDAQTARLFDYTNAVPPAEGGGSSALPPVQQFLKDAQVALRARTDAGITTAWDLSSLLIKPVQRVLRYPLLLGQLRKEVERDTTSGGNSDVGAADDADADENAVKAVTSATEVMGRIADGINEGKRRKDTVEKYVEGKGGANVIHGISKKFTRGIEELKHVTKVVDGTRDEEYDEASDKFHAQHTKLLTLQRDVMAWLKSVKDALEAQEMLAASFEEVYMVGGLPGFSAANVPTNNVNSAPTSTGGILAGVRSIGNWTNMRRKNPDVSESDVRSRIAPSLQALFSRLKEPILLMKKRDNKLMDFDRVKRMHTKGEAVDKALEDSATEYKSINAELILELPKLTALIVKFVDFVVLELARIQTRVHEQVMSELQIVVGAFEGGSRNGWIDIVEEYKGTTLSDQDLANRIWDIGILERWRDEVWRNDESIEGARTGSTGFRLGSSSLYKPASSRGSISRVSRAGTESIKTTRTIADDSTVSSTIPTSNARRFSYMSPMLGRGHLAEAISSVGNNSNANADTYASPGGFAAEALYRFAAETEDELEMQAGDVVWITATSGRNGDEDNEDWWYAIQAGGGGSVRTRVRDGKEGWVPRNYLSTAQQPLRQ
ncbi:hypothetical protein HDU82_008985 [Entophlyctis luteolus]|nr:hypothetical protein HDU82_008985 [Entophlyctis luteolus]